jgi:hypothetical protein
MDAGKARGREMKQRREGVVDSLRIEGNFKGDNLLSTRESGKMDGQHALRTQLDRGSKRKIPRGRFNQGYTRQELLSELRKITPGHPEYEKVQLQIEGLERQ